MTFKLLFQLTEWKILTILNILRSTPKIMKYCNDCLTPIKSDSREEYCAICKKARALKENSVAQDSDFQLKYQMVFLYLDFI